MRIYGNGLAMRTSAVDLLKIYNSVVFNSGNNVSRFDRKVTCILMVEFIGLEDIHHGKRPEPCVIDLMQSIYFLKRCLQSIESVLNF